MNEKSKPDNSKRNYKDSMFCQLFNDEEKILELYNALSGKDYPEGTSIEIVTLDDAFFNDVKNDLAFVIDKKYINLTEHQSTLSPNMPLRFLEYITKEYHDLFISDEIYSTTPLDIPTPEFYVLYNGTKDAPLQHTLKLSDTFAGECDTISFELIVQVINVNYDKGSDILEKCETLKNYSIFIHKVREKLSKYRDRNTAITETIDECIHDGILVDFLKKNRGNIMSFLQINLSEEERRVIDHKDGYLKGIKEEKHSTARRMKAANMPIEQIIAITELSKEEIEKL